MVVGSKIGRFGLRYSLRAMLIAVTLFCVWIGIQADRANQQRDAVLAIRALGGVVTYSSKFPASPAKDFVRRWLSRDYVDDVVRVSFNKRDAVTDQDMKVLRGLPRLKELSLNECPITDAGLKDLRWATDLVRIDLLRTQVTDEGLVHLTALRRLEFLWLNETQITDAGLAHLAKLTRLETLYLGGNKIGDAGIEHLSRLPALKQVQVGATMVTDRGREYLEGSLPQCKVIAYGKWDPR